ncbi:MAG: cell division protein FtsZ [Metamycoplasmataceae bacterium]
MMNVKETTPIINIKVIGVGGCGTNSVAKMVSDDFEGVEFIFANTDKQALDVIQSNNIIHLESEINNGMGAGANPEVGRNSALNSEEKIRNKIIGAKLVIITAGMGGGTGTGASPIIARIAKEMDILTIAIVTTPFTFEGRKRDINSQRGIKELKKIVDSLIIVSNNKLLENYSDISFEDSFTMADKILKNTVQILTDIILKPSYINLDFADVCSIIKEKENAYIWQGRATGRDKAEKAILKAISSNMLENSINDSTDAIVNITGGSDISLKEANFIISKIKEQTNENINIIFGIRKDENIKNEIQVSIIATSGKTNYKSVNNEVNGSLDAYGGSLDSKNNNNEIEFDQEFSLMNTSIIDDTFKITDEDDDEIPFFLK